MATFRFCSKHGIHEGKTCPKCPKPVSKASKKYGKQTVIIPPNMRAVK